MNHAYGISSAQNDLVESARGIADKVARPVAADVDSQARFPSEAMTALSERGFFGLCLPTDFGGKAQPPRVFAAVAEELAMACASTAMIYVMHVSASQTFAASETIGDRETLLRQVCAGKHLTTLAFSERGSRSQFWAPVSKLEPTSPNNGCLTNAYKSWVTSANHADSYVASAQMPGAESPLESTLYLARRGAEGMRIVSAFDGLGLRGNDSAPVEMKDMPVASGDLLTAQGEGATAMLQVVLPWFSVGTATMAHGLCRAAIAATCKHLTEATFQDDGTKLRDLPNLRARVAEMNLRTEQSRALLGHTVSAMEQPDEQTPLLVLQSRMSALTAAVDVTDLAMKACGGAAFSKHLGIERLFRDARAGWVMAPTVDHLHEFVGRALTGLPLF
jgi:alkylation response protein AidB-like acyl-CoA dehydrogenase